MKKVLMVLGGIFAVIIVIVVFAFIFTAGVTDSADKFFTLIKENKLQEAYSSTAKEFQAATSYDAFSSFLAQSSMGKYVSGSWSSRSIDNDQGSVEGSITTSDKGVIPVQVNFVKEAGEWKVLNLKPTSGGLQPTTSSTSPDTTTTKPLIPSDADITKLTNTAMISFSDGVKAADFTAFYGTISNLWKAQTTAAELNTTFAPFVAKKVDISYIASATPTLSEKPSLDDNNVLKLVGSYPSSGLTAYFTLKFIYEYPAWKLMGIDVNVK